MRELGTLQAVPSFLPHLQQMLIDRIDNIGYRGQRIVTGHYFRAMSESTCCGGGQPAARPIFYQHQPCRMMGARFPCCQQAAAAWLR